MALAVTAGTASVPAHGDDLKHKKHRVERTITSAKADVEDSSKAASRARQLVVRARVQLVTAEHRLAATRGRLSTAQALDARMQAELVVARSDLLSATAELETGRQRVKEQRATVGRYAAENVQRANPQLVGLVAMMNADNPAVLTTEMKTVGNLMQREDDVLGDLRDARAQLAVNERKVEQARDAVAEKRAEAAANLAVRQKLEKRALVDTRDVSHLVASRRAARRTADSAARSDRAELARLNKENDRIAAMLAARAHRATSQGNNGPLQRPVTGYVTSPFGWRIHPIYGYRELHNGTDFHAPCGTPLRAAGNGTVVSEYPQTAWGNRLILDLGRIKGHGISVIYNHISAYRVGTGARVTRGETVAYAGTTGWSTACHLHFTVMVDGVAQNPMDWF